MYATAEIAFEEKAPFLTIDEIRALTLRKLIPDSVLDRTEEIWLLGSFTNPGKDIDKKKRSDLDIYAVISDWDSPIAMTSLAMFAPQSPVVTNIQEGKRWTGVIGPEGVQWNCSASEAWDQLPVDVHQSIVRSVQVKVFTHEQERDQGMPRNVDLMIGSKGGLEYSRELGRVEDAPLPGIQIWTPGDD